MRFSLRLHPVSSKSKVRAEVSFLYHETELEMKSRYISRDFFKVLSREEVFSHGASGSKSSPFRRTKVEEDNELCTVHQ